LAVQSVVSLTDPQLTQAPLLVVLQAILGRGFGIPLMVLLILAVISTNLNGAIWAASRLVFDIGRNRWAPRTWALDRLDGSYSTPRRAILCIGILFTLVLTAYGLNLLNLADLLRIAGQNFFLLYTFSIITYIKVESTAIKKLFGITALLICLIFMGVYGWSLLYALFLFALPYCLGYRATPSVLKN